MKAEVQDWDFCASCGNDLNNWRYCRECYDACALRHMMDLSEEPLDASVPKAERNELRNVPALLTERANLMAAYRKLLRDYSTLSVAFARYERRAQTEIAAVGGGPRSQGQSGER